LTTTPASTTTAATTTTTIPEPPITQALQSAFVVREDDLPVELRPLIPRGVSLQDGPRHFSTFKWQWIELRFVSYDAYWLREPGDEPVQLGLASGTQLLDTAEKAEDLYAEAVATTVASPGVETFDVPLLGEESTGIVVHSTEGELDRWETFVVFRRGPLLAHVTMTRGDAADDRAMVTELAELVAVRIESAIAGDYHIPEVEDRFHLETAPPRQLGSYAFDFTINVDLGGLRIDVKVDGEFLAPDLMWCQIESLGERVLLMSRGEEVVLDLDGHWERVDSRSEDIAGYLSVCPGHVLFYDESFPLTEEDFVFSHAVGRTLEYAHPEYTVVDDLGVEARRYELEGLLEWAELVDYYQIEAGPGGGLFPDELGELFEFEVSFATDGGWAPQLRFVADLDPVLLFGAELSGDELVPMAIEYTITRPNDPAISIEFPEDLTEV
jgi:hypothetical protein